MTGMTWTIDPPHLPNNVSLLHDMMRARDTEITCLRVELREARTALMNRDEDVAALESTIQHLQDRTDHLEVELQTAEYQVSEAEQWAEARDLLRDLFRVGHVQHVDNCGYPEGLTCRCGLEPLLDQHNYRPE